MKNIKRILLCLVLSAAMLSCICSVGVLADTSMMSPEDGMISDSGTDHALTPEAGTVQGGEGEGIMDGVSDVADRVSEGVSDVMDGVSEGASDVVSDVMDGTQNTAADTGAVDGTRGSATAAVIIFIIIAIAVVALILVLVPKRRD